jgi:hypothetical protein
MRGTSRCGACAAFIRWGKNEDGQNIAVDSDAVEHGNVWVLEWDGGDPLVRVEESPEHVPANVPLRYTRHADTCRLSSSRVMP